MEPNPMHSKEPHKESHDWQDRIVQKLLANQSVGKALKQVLVRASEQGIQSAEGGLCLHTSCTVNKGC